MSSCEEPCLPGQQQIRSRLAPGIGNPGAVVQFSADSADVGDITSN
jgi:hypothetical protein